MKEPVLRALEKKILPQESTGDDLQAAIDSAALEDVIVISGNMSFTNTVMIPADKEITIRSDMGNNRGVMESPGIRHFMISGSLILDHITLDCVDGNAGGIEINSGGKFVMNNEAVIQNCFSYDGGGVSMNNDCRFTMNSGAVIQNCTANTSDGYGGGVVMRSDCRFIMNGSAVIQNCISRNGGGIGMKYGEDSQLTMNDNALVQNCGANYRGGGVIMNDGKSHITVMNDTAAIRNCTAGWGGGTAVGKGDKLFMNGSASIHDCMAHNEGGGVFIQYDDNQFFMNGNAVIQNCTAAAGGGICIHSNGQVIMNDDSEIKNCTAGYNGGGVMSVDSSRLIMNDRSMIQYCAVYENGGGVFVRYEGSRLVMRDDAIIKKCIADANGGGVFLYDSSAFTMSGGTISGCKANNGHGGGICASTNAAIEITGDSRITDDSAPNGNGGGIYTSDYRNLSTGSNVVFAFTYASAAHAPPQSAAVLYPNLRFARTAIADHPLNNYDINYTRGKPIVPTHNAVYDANGGTGGYADTDIPYRAEYTVLPADAVGVSRAGYTFDGWNMQPDGNGTAYASGDVIIADGDVTFYAQWTAVFYAVIYHANGGTGGRKDTELAYGSEYTVLSADEAEIGRPGYAFNGWNVQADNSGTGCAPNDTLVIHGDVTLYAQWTAISYKVIYCANNGTGGHTDMDIAHGSEYTVLSADAAGISRAGHTFSGWNMQPDNCGTGCAPNDTLILHGDVILYAQWTAILYKVIYHANDGTGGYTDMNIAYGSEYTVLSAGEVGISRAGHTFSGWNMQPDNSGTGCAPNDTLVIHGDVTLHARWTAILYTVIYHANDGTGGHMDMDIAHGSEYTVLSADTVGISRAGHTFNGWNMQPDNGGTGCTPNDTLIINGDVTLHAQWTSIVYTVIYHANDETGNHMDVEIVHGSEYTVLSADEVGISRAGYTFSGWNMQRDGSGTACAPGDTLIIHGDVTLHAQWESIYVPCKNEYCIEFFDVYCEESCRTGCNVNNARCR